MPAPPDPEQVSQALDELLGHLQSAHDASTDEGFRSQLRTLRDAIQEGQARAIQEYQQRMAALDQRIAAAKQRAEASLQKAREAQARLKELPREPKKKLERKPPPKPVDEPIDPKLGQNLKQELLERFGGRPRTNETARRQELDQTVWDDWGS